MIVPFLSYLRKSILLLRSIGGKLSFSVEVPIVNSGRQSLRCKVGNRYIKTYIKLIKNLCQVLLK